jgi:protein-tyrosine phosphatase
MIDVVFVCLGNICRSPMAEAVFKRIIKERGVELSFNVSSFATSACEEGNPIYPPAVRVLKKYGYDFSHTARQISLREIKNADYLLVMDEINLRDLTSFVCGNYGDKIFKLGHFLPEKIDIDDPWYTGDFERTYREIYSACTHFLDFLLVEHAEAFDYDKRH